MGVIPKNGVRTSTSMTPKKRSPIFLFIYKYNLLAAKKGPLEIDLENLLEKLWRKHFFAEIAHPAVFQRQHLVGARICSLAFCRIIMIVGVRADSSGANQSLKRSSLHLHGLLRSPAGSCIRLASPFCVTELIGDIKCLLN